MKLTENQESKSARKLRLQRERRRRYNAERNKIREQEQRAAKRKAARRIGMGLGPPRKQLTGAQLVLVVKLKSQHLSESTIAVACGMSPPTFRAYKQAHPELQDALDYGKGLALDKLVGQLAKQGRTNFVPNIYLAKSMHGLVEGGEGSGGGSAHVTINLPGAMQVGNLTEEQQIGMTIEGELADDPAPIQSAVPQRGMGRANSDGGVVARTENDSRPQTAAERRAAKDFEASVGIRTDRASFPSEAAWRRYNKQR